MRHSQRLALKTVGRSRRAVSLVVTAAVLLSCGSGCSLFVMAGKMFFGDPTIPSHFHRMVGIDLTDGEHSVLVVTTTPEAIKRDAPAIDLDITERVSRRLKNKGVDLFPSGEVLTWLDDRGGRWDDVDEIARAFETDYIVHCDLRELTFYEENSSDLYRGKVNGSIYCYEVAEENGVYLAQRVFNVEFDSTYPSHRPKLAHQMSERIFREEFVDRVCKQVALTFYDHKLSEEID
ncbi:hypothetical protein [Stratiformator vulcanicus]|uniref:Lipoprotein n=1 Tax=Stratiformator vulcanicus TaxID=2527980 RepID=A0A517QZ60_9PLAN|nr:hypothetical protein [Stratiformator vulcanicus]QDT36929.1 hypothetical protein Pan189_12930 [Stratiformator vulcanicus]